MREEMIRQMRILRAKQEELQEATKRGQQLIHQVTLDVAQDLDPLQHEVQDARVNLETMIRQENEGAKFKCPGLGTVYLSKRRRTTVVDQEAFIQAFDDKTDGASGNFYERKLVPSRVKQAAEGYLEEYGELLAGVESEEVETLNVRFK